MLLLVRSIEVILAALLLGLAWITWRRRARLGQPGRLLWVTIRLFLAVWLILLGVAVEEVLLPGDLWATLYWVCMLLPFPAGFLVGWWRSNPGLVGWWRSAGAPSFGFLVVVSLLDGILAGALVMELNQVVLTAAGSYPKWFTWHWDDVLPWFFLFGLFGSAQGFIGALLGASLGAWGWRHRRRGAMPSTVAP
jgi:hypothetical protein